MMRASKIIRWTGCECQLLFMPHGALNHQTAFLDVLCDSLANLRFRTSWDIRPNPHCKNAEAAFHYARRGPVFKAAAACMFVHGTGQQKRQCEGRAAVAQQQHALLVAIAPQLHPCTIKRATRQREPQLRMRLQIMRAHAARAKENASG
jgi:hypothetical protein